MIISKVILNMREAVRQSYTPVVHGSPGKAGAEGPAGVPGETLYDAHQALWRLFSDGPDRRRDFLYREMEPGSFITVSARMPLDTGPLWSVRSKDYAPRLHEGERLHFSLRVNPVRKTRSPSGRQQRHDVVQDARKRWLAEHGGDSEGMPSRIVLAQDAGWAWFAARAEGMGLTVSDADRQLFAVERYLPCGFTKRRADKAYPEKRTVDAVSISLLDMTGFATVADPVRLQNALFSGVGCAKGFGCGLLLVRRADHQMQT